MLSKDKNTFSSKDLSRVVANLPAVVPQMDTEFKQIQPHGLKADLQKW